MYEASRLPFESSQSLRSFITTLRKVSTNGYQTLRSAQTRQAFETLLGWYSEGRLHPQIAATVPLECINHALQMLACGAFSGKVIATVPTLTWSLRMINPLVHIEKPTPGIRLSRCSARASSMP